MDIQINSSFVDKQPSFKVGTGSFMLTPPIDGDYWFMRVPLTEKQAIVCFPKFTTFGIGFQVEEDWNTNLPYTCPAEEIFDHISHNKGDDNIADCQIIEAIRLLQQAIQEFKAQSV